MSVSVASVETQEPAKLPAATDTPTATARQRALEILACAEDPAYFLDNYCKIYDAVQADWIPFRLWPEQIRSVDGIVATKLSVILKARQLGFSWLVLGIALWLMLFWPAATILIFSKRDDEATELLSFRLKGMHERLPEWLRAKVDSSSGHQYQFANGSRAMAFPTTGGRSYTGTFVIVDEADFVPDLNELLNAVKPTIDAGGKLVLVSTVNKDSTRKPIFQNIYRAARLGTNDYRPIFCSWRARPDRTDAWYESQKRDVLARTGSLDDLWQEYPSTDTEALSARTLDKRIPGPWLEQCFVERTPLLTLPEKAPSIPGLSVFVLPQRGDKYVIGGDPAEGNPTSDDSCLCVLDFDTGEQVAELVGKIDPTVLADYCVQLGQWYNKAPAMIERNNHGHAVLAGLSGRQSVLNGHDGRPGWLSSNLGKAILYDHCADAFRNKETILHSFATFTQLASIDGSTLRAPEGQHDDRADGYALAVAGRIAPRLTLLVV